MPWSNSPKAVPEVKFRLTEIGGVKRDVHDGFELDGFSLPRRRPKSPLAQGIHGVLVELLVDSADQLNAVHRTVAPNHGVENHFAFHVLVDQRRWILRIDFPYRGRPG